MNDNFRRFDASTRTFLKSALGLSVGAAVAGWAGPSRAQGKVPMVDTDYRLIRPPQTPDIPNKIEVIEFFWFGCPHCNMLEPALRDWVAQLPGDVAFEKVHVPFNIQRHQQLYYTLVTMGKADPQMIANVFAIIHGERNMLDTPEKMTAALAKYGIDKKAFMDAWGAFSTQTRVRKATAMSAAYKVDSVPMLAVNGKYVTAPSMAGSNANAIAVVNYLIDRERKGAK